MRDTGLGDGQLHACYECGRLQGLACGGVLCFVRNKDLVFVINICVLK